MISATPELEQAIEHFLVAFRALEWEPFIATFTTDATVFFPFPDQPRRATGIDEIRAIFYPFFQQIRQQRSAPPYLELVPLDMEITGNETMALVTFHLHDAGQLCRRTLVWVSRQVGPDIVWQLHHLHASNLTMDAASQR